MIFFLCYYYVSKRVRKGPKNRATPLLTTSSQNQNTVIQRPIGPESKNPVTQEKDADEMKKQYDKSRNFNIQKSKCQKATRKILSNSTNKDNYATKKHQKIAINLSKNIKKACNMPPKIMMN